MLDKKTENGGNVEGTPEEERSTKRPQANTVGIKLRCEVVLLNVEVVRRMSHCHVIVTNFCFCPRICHIGRPLLSAE